MSLAARCPWCETVFRLTEGQVSAKGGMARCGVCNHTFNALDALLSDSAVAAIERSAQAREANQEAAARASEQSAGKAPEGIPIPLSIRKMFGGANTLASAPPVSNPASLAPSSPGLLRTPLAGAVPDQTVPANPAAAPVQMPLYRPAQAPVQVPVQAPTPAPIPAVIATPAPAPEPVEQVAPAAEPISLPVAASEPVETVAATSPEATQAPAALQAEATDVAPPAEHGEAPSQPPDIPVDYKVEMPNYDAERAAALAEAERQQKEQQELKAQLEARASRADVAEELDAIQRALSPDLTEEEAEEEVVDQAPAATTLNSLRLQHAAIQAASKADLLREDERLGPNTFQPSFLQSNESSGRFRRTRRVLASVIVLLLTVGLLGQAIYWWRSDVAMRVPQSRPYLVRACQRLHCEVDPPTQIDQLSIESSELVAVPGNAGALSFTALVRNHSVNALAYPAIEITLTDARDQAVLRRVFLPDNYLGDALGARRLAGLPGNSEYTLKLTFNTSGVATSGYRAGIFYP